MCPPPLLDTPTDLQKSVRDWQFFRHLFGSPTPPNSSGFPAFRYIPLHVCAGAPCTILCRTAAAIMTTSTVTLFLLLRAMPAVMSQNVSKMRSMNLHQQCRCQV